MTCIQEINQNQNFTQEFNNNYNSDTQEYIYIVVSKTDTLLGKVIQRKLDVNYNHCSISLQEDLESFWAFGRKKINNMFCAGFVEESKSRGFFEKFNTSKIAVIKVPVSGEQYKKLIDNIEVFKHQREQYTFNALGLVYCYLGIDRKRKNKYFCAQFVSEVLNSSDINLLDKPDTLVRPHDFLKLVQLEEDFEIIYTGEIRNYDVS
ncbi:MAG: hypothetical protein R3Y29_04970 [bacterium]